MSVELDAVIVIVVNDAETVTVMVVVLPFMVPVMIAVPAPTPVSSPLELTVATAVFELVQITEATMLLVLPSLYVPVAVH
jgi:hypothetical protein